jgi:hypothetical protein
MKTKFSILLPLPLLAGLASFQEANEPQPIPGEKLDPSAYEGAWIETMEEAMARESARTEPYPAYPKARNGRQGSWEIPSLRRTSFPHSGQHYAAAKWGDTQMGIGFGRVVDVDGVWVAGHMDVQAWTSGVRAVGYLNGTEVASTKWFEDVDDVPSWFALDFAQVDRVVFEAQAIFEGGGFYGIDDLTYATTEGLVVVDFEDTNYRDQLTGSTYAGLTWETGTGNFDAPSVREVQPPAVPPGHVEDPPGDEGAFNSSATDAGTAPNLIRAWPGPKQGDPGGGWTPPDTCGAVGQTQFVASVNENLSVYDKVTQNRVTNISLRNFFNTGGSAGDPRVAYDPHHNRWIVICTDFSTKVRFAYSLTDDATGAWFKANVILSQGSNSGDWPDYPTLGVDANGIYMGAYMVGSVGMSIFAIDKTPLLTATPSLGTVSAWRQLSWEGAIQPCVTYGNPPGEYLISRVNSSTQRIRRVNPPLSSPTMTEMGFVNTINGSSPPSAPAQGSSFNLDTLDGRPMNAVFRNGSVWMTHGVSKGGRAAINWYEINPVSTSVVQQGSVTDSTNYYYMPSIAVNANGDVALGFSASHSGMYAGAWFTGRLSTDPSGDMGPPAEYKKGAASYNQSGGGTNRWGDYSVTSIDPNDDLTFWTIQEYAKNNGDWGTNIAEISYATPCGSSVNYCTAGTSTSGCVGTVVASGTPSSTASSGFTLTGQGIEGNKDAIFFWGLNGRQANPWGSSTSFQCVVPPAIRGGLLALTGTTGQCDGAPSQDLNALWCATCPKPAKNPGAGATVQSQCWYRDPFSTSNQTTALSDGIEFVVCP